MPIVLEEESEAPARMGGGGGMGGDIGSAITTEGAPPDASQAAAAFGQGAASGVARGAPIAAGVAAGAIGGAALGSAVPVIGTAVGGAVGAVGGGIAGFFAGDALASGLAEIELPSGNRLTFESLEQVPLKLRKYAVAGETMGGSIGFAGLPYVAAARGFRFAANLPGRFFNRVIEGAARNPVGFAAIEMQSAFSAGVGGGIAEEVDPGDGLSRFAGEVIGGALNPARWVMSAGRQVINLGKNIVPLLPIIGNAGKVAGRQEQSAIRELGRIMEEFGEDPKAVAQAIRDGQAAIPELKASAAVFSDSPALTALEAKLAADSAKFGSASREMAQDGLLTMKTLIGALEKTGDPQALRAAAQVRRDYFTNLLGTRLHSAEQAALEAAAGINPANARSRASFGVRVTEILDEAMTDVRAVEVERWGQVDQNLPGRADNLLQRLQGIRKQRLPEERLPEIVTGFEQRMVDGDGVTTSGELILIRSRMLKQARDAAATPGQADASRVFGELAEAALDDMDSLLVATPEQRIAYESAREWSRQLNDTFMRTFVGDALALKKTGAERIPPELVMKKAFEGGREQGDLRFREMEEAARMAGHEHVSRLLDVQERTIRFAADELIDQNGRINPTTLGRFRERNAELLDRFPEVRDQLETAQGAETFLRQTQATGKRGTTAIKDSAAFSKVLAGQDPVDAVNSALTGANPTLDFKRLADLAKRGGNDAMNGLKASVLAYAHQRSTTVGGNFNFATYRQTMQAPTITGGPSLQELMIAHGVADRQTIALQNRFLERAATIEQALSRGGPQLDSILAEGDGVADLTVRLMGARAAAMLPTGGAHGMIVGGAGVRFAQQVMQKVPMGRTRDLLAEAMLHNKNLMITLLEKPATQRDKKRLALQMNAFLFSWLAQEDD